MVVTPPSEGTDVADDLKLGLLNGGAEALRDLILRGSPNDDVTAGDEVVTDADYRFSFYDRDGDGVYDNGEDLYEEQTGGANTYSDGPDVLVYVGTATDVTGGSPGVAGSAALSIDDDDNIMFYDYDYDMAYDFGASGYEPLLYTGLADMSSYGVITNDITVLARYNGVWQGLSGMNMYQLNDYFNGNNGHDYYYIDDNYNGAYDDGEAIVDQIGGSSTILLEKGDFVIHQGQAGLVRIPVVQTGTWV